MVLMSLFVKVAMVFSVLMIIAIFASLPFTPALAGSDGDWKTAHIVGRFHYSNPPIPDQIFKIQYRVLNGTIENVETPSSIIFNVSTTNNGLLEVKFPRNHPYHNDMQSTPAGNFNFLNIKQNDAFESNVVVTDCFFVFSVPFNNDAEVTMSWFYILNGAPVHGDSIPESCMAQTLIENVPTKDDGTISPLHQVRAGVIPEGVLCRADLELILNPEGKPYCATEQTIEFLNKVWYR